MAKLRQAIALAVAIVTIPSVLSAQSDAQRQAAGTGVVMLRSRLPAGQQFGAGIVVAASTDAAFVATANHLVRRGGTASSVEVQFRGAPGQWFSGRLLDLRDPDLDLAIVAVSVPASSRSTLFGSTNAATTSLLARGTDVFPMGFSGERPWNTVVAPDKVANVTALRVIFQSQFVRPGNSGGPLLDACGRIVGMVTGVEPPDAEAVRIDPIIEAVKKWSLGAPTNLSMQTAACGATQPSTQPSVPPPVQKCDVSLRSTPTSAEVYIDGRRVGSTPLTVSLSSPDTHNLRIELDQHETFEQDIDCKSGSITARLEPSTVDIILAYGGDMLACTLQLEVDIGGRTAIPRGNRFRMTNVPAGEQDYSITGQIGCPTAGVCRAEGEGTIDVVEGDVYNVVWFNTSFARCDVTLE